MQHLDPALAYDTTSWTVTRMLYDQLVMYAENSTELIPGLAEAMPTVSADGLTYTFKLRPGVKFIKGDGTVLRDMTADDVVASLNRILDPKLKPNPSPVGAAFFSIIDGAQAVLDGKATDSVGSGRRRPADRRHQAGQARQAAARRSWPWASVSIVPKELAGQDTAAFEKAPVGTGPYYLESYHAGQQGRPQAQHVLLAARPAQDRQRRSPLPRRAEHRAPAGAGRPARHHGRVHPVRARIRRSPATRR